MNTSIKRTGLVSAIVALASVAACSNKQESKVDPSLKADLAAIGGSAGDLQLAPSSAKSSVIVSEIAGWAEVRADSCRSACSRPPAPGSASGAAGRSQAAAGQRAGPGRCGPGGARSGCTG